ncbi:MAG: hypothetical protein E4H40_02075, partial [Candidatus Brocadiia bacterium]
MWFFKKTNFRRTKVHRSRIFGKEPFQDQGGEKSGIPGSILLLALFTAACVAILSYQMTQDTIYLKVIPLGVTVTLISAGMGIYIYYWQKRIVKNHVRAMVLLGLFAVMLSITKLGVLLFEHASWGTGTAVTIAIILPIAYD